MTDKKKKEIRFDHSKDSLFEALGLSKDEAIELDCEAFMLLQIAPKKSSAFEVIIRKYKDDPVRLALISYLLGCNDTKIQFFMKALEEEFDKFVQMMKREEQHYIG